MPALRKTERAREDLLAIWRALAASDLTAADRVFDRIEARLWILEKFPEAGAPRSDIAAGLRMLVERPYLILYRITGDTVQIVRILHGARRVDRVMDVD